MKRNRPLFLAGSFTAVVSLLHVLIIIEGGDWYRFFGAGEGMAQLAERGSMYPVIVTSSIAIVLGLWALYAFSGAGTIVRLPLLRPILILIALIFLLRGVLGIPTVTFMDHPYAIELRGRMTFMIVSALISLGIGLFYLFGIIRMKKSK